MASRAHPHAMAPKTPGRTRTAPPMTPEGWYGQKRMRKYLLFDATGVIYFLVAFVAIRLVWSLGEGPERYAEVLAQLSNPLYIAFHALSLAAVVFVGVEFFRRFPKAQPPRIGPAKPPPLPVLHAGLYAAWFVLTVALAVVLAGGIF